MVRSIFLPDMVDACSFVGRFFFPRHKRASFHQFGHSISATRASVAKGRSARGGAPVLLADIDDRRVRQQVVQAAFLLAENE